MYAILSFNHLMMFIMFCFIVVEIIVSPNITDKFDLAEETGW